MDLTEIKCGGADRTQLDQEYTEDFFFVNTAMKLRIPCGRVTFSLAEKLSALHEEHWYHEVVLTRAYPKVSGLSHNEINNNSLRSNTKGYGGKTH
jgi:hypothetical protein